MTRKVNFVLAICVALSLAACKEGGGGNQSKGKQGNNGKQGGQNGGNPKPGADERTLRQIADILVGQQGKPPRPGSSAARVPEPAKPRSPTPGKPTFVIPAPTKPRFPGPAKPVPTTAPSRPAAPLIWVNTKEPESETEVEFVGHQNPTSN